MSKKKKSDKTGVLGLILLFFWLIFILLCVVFYFYYWEELPFNKNSKDINETVDEVTEGELQDENAKFETVYKYQTNANPDINALIADYYSALASKDQKVLKTLVTDPSQFDDMTDVLAKAAVVTGYSNINCYTLDGLSDDATICYAVSNISIKSVESRPLDISCFYVVNVDGKYLIYNEPYSEEVGQYIKSRDEEEDIQALYQTVQDNINQCLEDDESFSTFYNRVNGNL